MIEKYNKYFVIGFNKTATTTIHNLFEVNNLKSQHTDKEWDLENFTCFSDNGNQRNYPELYSTYPNSIFILNVRKLNEWLLSRFKHGYNICKEKPINWAYPPTIDLCIEWIQSREEHHLNVLNFFKDKKNKLIIISIDNYNWLDYLALKLKLKIYNIKSQNIINTSGKHRFLIDIIDKCFQKLNYSSSEKKSLLLKNKTLENELVNLYYNNIY